MPEISKKAISKLAVKEKYIRKNHFNSLNVWWARRPTRAMRALLMNEIIKRKGERYILPSNLIKDINPDRNHLHRFKDIYNTESLNLLDAFSGGGAIPLEGSRLGLKTYSCELNPIAALAQETVFKSFNVKKFATLLEKYGRQTIDNTYERCKFLYDFIETEPYVIFWTRTANCLKCGENFDLGKLEYLKKRGEHHTVIQDDCIKKVPAAKNGRRKRRKKINCSNCGTPHTFNKLKKYCEDNKLGSRPLAFCDYGETKRYIASNEDHKSRINKISLKIDELLKKYSHLVPKSKVPVKSGVINPTLYDLKYTPDMFNERQLLITITLIDELTNTYKRIRKSEGNKAAKQVILGLKSLIEFQVDWNNQYTMWIPQNEQTGRSLAGPGVGMKWDYIEVNPFFNKGSNFYSKLDRVVSTFRNLDFESEVCIQNSSSTDLKIESNSIDIVLTDPPYYDSIDYTALSEFFRPWFEMLISNTFNPNIDLTNDTTQEAIAELSSSSSRSDSHYYNIMSKVFKEIERVVKNDGTFLMLYSHKTIEGWEVLSKALKNTKLIINNIIPTEMERIARPRAMNSQSLNGVIIFEITKQSAENDNIGNDLDKIIEDTQLGEISESQVLISLAALSCKYAILRDEQYMEVHNYILDKYKELRLIQYLESEIDPLTKEYVKARLSELEANSNKLNKNGLLSEHYIKGLHEIDIADVDNSVLKDSLIFIDESENGKSLTFEIDGVKRNKIESFLGLIGGNSLNTLKERSSDKELKMVRSALAKITEV